MAHVGISAGGAMTMIQSAQYSVTTCAILFPDRREAHIGLHSANVGK
jgi:hypothetical protein